MTDKDVRKIVQDQLEARGYEDVVLMSSISMDGDHAYVVTWDGESTNSLIRYFIMKGVIVSQEFCCWERVE